MAFIYKTAKFAPVRTNNLEIFENFVQRMIADHAPYFYGLWKINVIHTQSASNYP